MTHELALLAPAASVQPGDEVCVSDRIGFCVVSQVSLDERGLVRIVYFKHGEDSWSKGWQHTGILVERSLHPLRPDAILVVRRGDRERAETLRYQLELTQEERLEIDLEKQAERRRNLVADEVTRERTRLQREREHTRGDAA